MTSIEQHVLYALYALCRENRRVSATSIGRAASVTPTEAARALVELERRGLVDASRARLTMTGLMAAVRKGPAAGGPRIALRANTTTSQSPRADHELPVAALPSAPPPSPMSIG